MIPLHPGELYKIYALATHPDIWPHISEDGQDPRDFEPNRGNLYFLFGSNGYLEARKATGLTYDLHISMLPHTPDVQSFGMACLDALASRGAEKFIAQIAGSNRAARNLVNRCGFVQEGQIKNYFLRGGRKEDLVIYGKELWSAH